MPNWGWALIAGAILALLGVGWCYDSRKDAWEARAVRAEAQAAESRQESDSLKALSDSLRRLARDDAARASSLTPSPGRVRVLRDTLRLVDSTLVAVVDSLEDSAEAWRTAYERQREATALLAAAYDTLTASHDSLRATLAARPKPPPSLNLGLFRIELLPTLGVGGFAGVCTDWRGCAGGGVTLSWKVRPG